MLETPTRLFHFESVFHSSENKWHSFTLVALGLAEKRKDEVYINVK